jgi:hypothetical protein
MFVDPPTGRKNGCETAMLEPFEHTNSAGRLLTTTLRFAAPVLVMVNVNVIGVPAELVNNTDGHGLVVKSNALPLKTILHSTLTGRTIAVAEAVALVTAAVPVAALTGPKP